MQKETNSVYMLQKYHKILDSYGIKVKLFADDAKLYVKIVNSVDTAMLQAALFVCGPTSGNCCCW